MLSFVRKLWMKLSSTRGTDVVEIADTTTSDLDYAIPELFNRGSFRSNANSKIFSKKHGKSVRTIRGKA